MHGHPKLRIKIPKLVVKTMQRKFHCHIKDNATANDSDNRSTRSKRGNQFPRKLVGSVFSIVLGNKRSLGKYPSKRKKNGPHGDSGDGKEWHITGKASSGVLGNNLVCGDEPVIAALSHLLTNEETLEPDVAGEGKQNIRDKQHVKMNLPLLSFLDKKKKGWNNFIKAKTRTIRFSSDMHDDGSKATKDGNDVVTRLELEWRKASSCRLVRIPSRILVIRLKLKMIRSLMKKKETKQFEQDLLQEGDENGDEDEDGELCKKRILMGGRCKPLSSSGTLRYDKDGLFLPEIVP